MDRLRVSQEVKSCDEILLKETEDIETLLNTTLDAEGDASDGALEQVCRFLGKVSEVGGTLQEVNHELLQRIFKCLQTWALSPALSKLLEIGIVRLLAAIYDNFIQSDYSRDEVLACILELLFVVEDMSDSSEGKIQCGKFFLLRLLALATTSTKLPSVRLQRAAVETICALVTQSPENQLAVLDQKVECYKLFKMFLPRCGDFQLQASIMEIYYRLVKRGPQLLEFVQDKAVRKLIEALMQSKKPDLLSEIRTILTLLNESLGHARSIYSFLAERIFINGHKITTRDKWVNFGRAQLSFFISGLPDSAVEELSIIDVQYEDIVELKRTSPTLLEIHLQDIPGLSSFKAVSLESGPSTVLQAQMFFSSADLATVEEYVFPKIRALAMRRQGKRAWNSGSIDKSTNKGQESVPVNFMTVHPTNMNSHPRNEASPAEDGRLPKRAETRGPNDKSSFDYMHTAPDFVSETPPDLETLEGATTQDYARSEMNKVLAGMTSDGPKSSKPPGRQAQDCCQPVAAVSSTFDRFNPHVAARQPFPRRQEDHQLQNSNMESIDANRNMSLRPPIDGQADVNQSRSVAIAARDSNKHSEIYRSSKPSLLKTKNLEDLSGPKTKSPADANLSRARVIEIDDDTTDDTDDRARVGELRMKKRQDSRPTNVVPLEVPLHGGENKLVGNTSRQVNKAELQEPQRSSGSSERNMMTPPTDMLASDSVMTDIREKPVTAGKATKTCRKKSSRDVANAATGQAENGSKKNVSRTLSKRKCKKATSYFDAADDELTSAASDSSTEFLVTRQKKSRGMVTDPIVSKSAKSSAHTITKCARRAPAAEENRAPTVCQRNGATPHKQPCRQKTSTMSVTRKQISSTNRQASHVQKAVCASSSRKYLGEDVFCFNASPADEYQSRKTSLALGFKAKRNSDYAEPYRKRRKNPAAKSHNLLSAARQRSCISEGPRPVIPVKPLAQIVKSPRESRRAGSHNLPSVARQRSCVSEGQRPVIPVRQFAQIMKSPPRASPAGSPSPPKKQDEVTPEQPGAKNAGTSAFSRSSDSDEHSRSPLLRTRKTYTKSDKIITKTSRLERWKSFSIRKLDFPTVDATSQDEFSDDATPGSSPQLRLLCAEAKAFEVEDAEPDSEDSSGIGMIAKLLKNFKQKVKLMEKKTVGDVLSNTMQRIAQEIQSAEEQVRGEKTEFLDACNKQCGQLDSQLQDLIKKMRAMYDKFHLDFAQHLERHDVIVGEIQATEIKLNDLAKQQGQDHKDVLAKLKESCKDHLADADQKILDVGKSSAGMRGLKDAVQGLLKDL